jgi:HD-GYP domain-containing protein (c-di-GMP phosphodiesterase class II)
MLTFVNHKKTKIAIITAVTAVTALLHFGIPTEQHAEHMLHIMLRKVYFLPPVLASVWFGLRGSVFVTAAVSALFSLHAFLDWPGNYMEQANQMGELASFWVVGLVSGRLFDQQRLLAGRLARANEETYLALVSALDLRERLTALHSQRVRDYALLLAERLGVPEEQRRGIGLGALLHDVGKIAVPDRILLKPGGLSTEDWQEMRKHPEECYRLLKPISSLAEAAEIVYTHHERFDGSGYPQGLRGEEIPLGARIFAVVDAFDALTSDRPYRKASGYEGAARIIGEESGRHFDPHVVAAFNRIRPSEWVIRRENYIEGETPSPPGETRT